MTRMFPFFLAGAMLLSSCMNIAGEGHSTFIKDVRNITGNKKAILFLRVGGATVGDSYQVSVKDGHQVLQDSEVGNTFTADAVPGRAMSPQSINFIWQANDTLRIEYDKQLRTFIKEPKVNGVTILYAPK